MESYVIEDYESGIRVVVNTPGDCFAVRQDTIRMLVNASDLLDLHCAIELIKSECRLEDKNE